MGKNVRAVDMHVNRLKQKKKLEGWCRKQKHPTSKEIVSNLLSLAEITFIVFR